MVELVEIPNNKSQIIYPLMLRIKSTIYLTGQVNSNDRNSKSQKKTITFEPVWNLMLEI